MRLAQEVSEVLLEIALFAKEVHQRSPDRISLQNEVRRLHSEASELYRRAMDADYLRQHTRIGVPIHQVEDIRLGIRLLKNSIAYHRDFILTSRSYTQSIQHPQAAVYQNTYSSSESCLSPGPSTTSLTTSPCRCMRCGQAQQSLEQLETPRSNSGSFSDTSTLSPYTPSSSYSPGSLGYFSSS